MELIKNATKDKLRGGFYTPTQIADFILKWAFNGHKTFEILEPSCGNGVFLEQIKHGNFSYKSILAIELDPIEAKKAAALKIKDCQVQNKEFHAFANNFTNKFDLIIGNPPFIRYQYFDKKQQLEAGKIFKKAALTYSKLTNAWVSFLIGSSLLLKENGKMGFVVPAEILQVSFAKQLRKHLARTFNKISIVSFKKLVFPSIQQEVVLLFCEKDGTTKHTIEHLEAMDANDLRSIDVLKLKTPHKKIDFKSNKWTFYFLDQREIDFIEEIQQRSDIKKLADYAKVEVGITTGANPFFTVPTSTVNTYNLSAYAKPMVGRSVQVSSAILSRKDWEINQKSAARANILIFPSLAQLSKHTGALKYIKYGETKGIHKGYKCGIRDEWQTIPSVWASDALFIRRNHLFPKFIVNELKAFTTDTMHRVTIKAGVNKNALIASYYNSMSLAFTEICGRSHGGGVLELMPNEVEDVAIPYSKENADLIFEIDSRLRAKQNINDILSYTDSIILKKALGLSSSDIKIANDIWKKLSNRRLYRGRS